MRPRFAGFAASEGASHSHDRSTMCNSCWQAGLVSTMALPPAKKRRMDGEIAAAGGTGQPAMAPNHQASPATPAAEPAGKLSFSLGAVGGLQVSRLPTGREMRGLARVDAWVRVGGRCTKLTLCSGLLHLEPLSHVVASVPFTLV